MPSLKCISVFEIQHGCYNLSSSYQISPILSLFLQYCHTHIASVLVLYLHFIWTLCKKSIWIHTLTVSDVRIITTCVLRKTFHREKPLVAFSTFKHCLAITGILPVHCFSCIFLRCYCNKWLLLCIIA